MKDWGENVIELMTEKKLQETVHSTLLLVCFCLLYMLYSHLSFVASFKLSCVYVIVVG